MNEAPSPAAPAGEAAPPPAHPAPNAKPAEGAERKLGEAEPEAGSEAHIRAARQDPLSDARGAEDVIAAARAYESFQRSFSATGPVGVVGPAIGNQFHFHSAVTRSASVALASGPVRAELLAGIGEWYATAPADAELRSALSGDRLVVLAGAAGSGRTTTAVRLLAEFAPGRVHRLSARQPIGEIDEDRIVAGHGYVAEPDPGGRPPTEADLDAFAARLAARAAYCVLIPAAEDEDGFAGHYLHTHRAPRPHAIFERRVESFRGRAEADGDADRAGALCGLAADPELLALLGSGPEPADEVLLAELVAAVAEGRIERAEVIESGGGLLDRHIESWLARLPEGVDLHRHRGLVDAFAFRVALAVFNESPANMVWEAGARLAWELHSTANPRLTPGRAVFSRLDEELLARQAKARLHDGAVEVADASVPARILSYREPLTAPKLLAAVWNGRPNLRRPILRWLQDLSQDRRPDVWMRAALAIGLVTSWDFAFCYHKAMEGWVGSELSKRRLVAAIALDQAARDKSTRGAVKALLKQWARSEDKEQMWTAAVVLGYETGARDTSSTLSMLRRIGVWDECELVDVASQCVADLFARGRFTEVLGAIDDWIADPRLEHHVLGLVCTLRIGFLRVRGLGNVEDLPLDEAARRRLAEPELAGWPLAVALARVSSRLGRALAECVWQVLAGSLASNVMRDEIAGWIRVADSSPGLIGPLGDFLGKLVDDADDEARLLDVVAMLVADPDEPIAADTAQAVSAAVTRRRAVIHQLTQVGG